jgi:hypothetical protein
MKRYLVNAIPSGLIIASGVAFLYIFVSIAVTGGYRAYEPNRIILISEIGMGSVYLFFGLSQFIKYVKSEKNDKNESV